MNGVQVQKSGFTGTETILLVEDEKAVRQLVQLLLEVYGYKVVTQNSGNNAFAYYIKHQHEIDLVLTDIVMPGMNGLDLYAKLNGLFPHVKVLFMSGYVMEQICPDMVLLQKPFSHTELAQVVRCALDT